MALINYITELTSMLESIDESNIELLLQKADGYFKKFRTDKQIDDIIKAFNELPTKKKKTILICLVRNTNILLKQ